VRILAMIRPVGARAQRSALAVFTLACLTFAPPFAAGAFADPLGHSVLARAGGDAKIVWDASPEVERLVAAKMGDARAAVVMRGDAARIAAKMLPLIEKGSRTVTVRVLYVESAKMSNAYRGNTFQHTDTYAMLSMPYRDAASNRDRWMQIAPGKPLPRWMTYTVTGKLPPMQ
jgi:hypothetical protein